MNFCPKCGKEVESGIFCKDCSDRDLIDIQHIKLKNVLICNECGKILHLNKWTDYEDVQDLVKKIFKDEILKSNRVQKGTKIELEFPTDFYDKLDVARSKYLIQMKIHAKKENITEEYDLNGRMVLETCQKCSRKDSKYFEGVLQIRNQTPELKDYLLEVFDRVKEDKIYVTAVLELKNGIDYYMTSKKFITRIIYELQEKFGGTVNVSEQLFTHNHLRSKDVFRVNGVFIQSPIGKGEFIKVDNSVVKVTSVSKNVFGHDIVNGSKVKLNFDIKYEKIKPNKVSVLLNYPKPIALDPETYESADIITDKELQVDQKIKVIKFNNNLYHV